MWSHFAREDNKFNLQLSRVNTQMASVNAQLTQDMKRDSSQMRSIAVLTMVFLPPSTVAVSTSTSSVLDEAQLKYRYQSIFSTSLFSWDYSQDKAIISGYLWVFIVIVVGLTCITLLSWYMATH